METLRYCVHLLFRKYETIQNSSFSKTRKLKFIVWRDMKSHYMLQRGPKFCTGGYFELLLTNSSSVLVFQIFETVSQRTGRCHFSSRLTSLSLSY